MKEALLYASAFIIEDDLMWFVPIRYNYLCCYNFTTEKVEKKFRLPEGNYYPRMYDNILSYERKLYLIPFNGSSVLIFDKETEDFQQISTVPFDSIKYKFCAATIYQNILYMFPERVAAEIEKPYVVVRVDLTEVEGVQAVELDVPVAPAGKPYYEVFDRQYFVTEDFVYILLQRTNKVLEYSLEKNTTKIYEVGGSENRYATMYMEGETFYFIDQDGDVTVWDKVKNKISKYKNEIPGYAVEKKELFAAFSASFKYGDSIYFVPRFANKVVRFDCKTNLIEDIFLSKEIILHKAFIDKSWDLGNFLHCFYQDNKIFMWNLFSCKFYCVNLNQKNYSDCLINTIFTYDEMLYLNDEYKGKNINRYVEDIDCYLCLDFYIAKILMHRYEHKENTGYDIGRRIYMSL